MSQIGHNNPPEPIEHVKPKKKQTYTYLSNHNFLEQLALSHDNWESVKHKFPGETPNASCCTAELCRMFMKLVDNYGKRANWRGYSWLDDMKGDALMKCMEGWYKFDKTKSDNPFSYFTQIIMNAFIRNLNLNHVQRDIRNEYMMAAGKDNFVHGNNEE